MSRDYKNTSNSNSRKKPAPARQSLGILPFLTGLSLGLFVAFFIYLQEHKPSTEPRRTEAPVSAETTASRAAAAKASEGIRPRFDFYTILPETEVRVPEWEPNADTTDQTPANDKTPPIAYTLQVGSFQKYEEADRVKARLALLGIQAEIQRVVINGQDVWFRVRVGPLKAGQQLQNTRNRLNENGMDSLLVKIRE
jgi:cell division protein FtsN